MNDAPDATGARQRSQAATRKRLQAAAVRLFAASGGMNTRTADIARSAGVAVGTVYLHFKNKDALLKAVLDEALAHLRRQLAARREAPEASAEDSVRLRMAALVAFVDQTPDHAAVLFAPASLATAPGREIHRFLVQSQEKGLVEGIAAGLYRSDLHAGLAARAMVGILIEVLGWWARHHDEASAAEVQTSLVEMRLRGLLAR